MALAAKTIKTGWRAFSTAFQSDFNVASVVNTSLNFEGVPSNVDSNNDWLNNDEITGSIGATIHQIINFIMNGEHNQKVASHQVGLIAGMAMGNVVTTGTTPRLHTITTKTTDMLLPCRTMVENDGFEQKQYTGVVCSQFTLEGKRNDFVKMNAALLGRGEASNSIIARPVQVVENYLLYANTSFLKGVTALNAELQDFKFVYNNNAKPIYEFNDATRYVSRFERGEIESTLDATVELITAQHFNDMVAGVDLAITITMTGSANNIVQITLPKCRIRSIKKDVDGEKLIAKMSFVVLQSGGSWVTIAVTNTQVAYNV